MFPLPATNTIDVSSYPVNALALKHRLTDKATANSSPLSIIQSISVNVFRGTC